MATGKWFGLALRNQFNGTSVIDWDTDTTIKVTLHTGAVPNQDTADFFDDISASEVAAGGGYTTGGVTLAAGNRSVTYDTATNETRLLSTDNPSWTSATFSATWAAIWKDTAGAASTDPLIGYVDFGGTETVTAGTFTITWDATGVLKITAA